MLFYCQKRMVSITRWRDLPEVPVFFPFSQTIYCGGSSVVSYPVFLTVNLFSQERVLQCTFIKRQQSSTQLFILKSASFIISKGKIVTFITSTVEILSKSSIQLRIIALMWQRETVQKVKRCKHLS